MPEIFLSYNREDAATAKLFADAFAREGLEVWWDQTLHSGDAYDEVTENALHSVGAVVVLWSPRSVASRWVRAEATVADQNKTFMPVMIAACRKPVMFELTQTADLSHWRGKADDPAWRTFVGDVRRMLGRKARPAAATIEPAVAAQGGAATANPRGRWTRRATVTGLVVAGGAAAIAYAGWLRPMRHVPDPRAVELYRRGQAIQKAGVYESMGEAIEDYKQAVAIDPRYAEAWAGIAIGQRYPVMGPIVSLSDPQEVRTAAGRALALDPDNADARLALIALYPQFRNWLEREGRLRAFLGDHPDSAVGNVLLGELLLDVGRIEEAVAVSRHVLEIEPMQQIGWITHAGAASYAGRISNAELSVAEGQKRWPQDRRIFLLGYQILLGNKRYAEAVAYIGDTSRRPREIPRELTESFMRRADALATGRGIAEFENSIRTTPASVLIENLPFSAPNMALIGMVDELFALSEAFFFGGIVNGTRVHPPGPLDPRPTAALFAPAVLALRDDPRFASLLARTGLEDYWSKSGTLPDFRRS